MFSEKANNWNKNISKWVTAFGFDWVFSLHMEEGCSWWPYQEYRMDEEFGIGINLLLCHSPASRTPGFLEDLQEMFDRAAVFRCRLEICQSVTPPMPQVVGPPPAPWGHCSWHHSRGLAALQEVPKQCTTSCIHLLFPMVPNSFPAFFSWANRM